MSKFNLRSGNSTSFKSMGASPAKHSMYEPVTKESTPVDKEMAKKHNKLYGDGHSDEHVVPGEEKEKNSPAKQSPGFNPKKETERIGKRTPTPGRKKKVAKEPVRETADSPTFEKPTKKPKESRKIEKKDTDTAVKKDPVKKDPIKKAIADKAAQVMAKPGQKMAVWRKAHDVYKATKAHR